MEDVAKGAKDFFPSFEIVKINNHLRLTKNVSEEVQRLASGSKSGVPNNVLMSNSTPPSNIAEGHPVIHIKDKKFISTLEECLRLCEGLKTMIVVDTKLASSYSRLQQFVQKTNNVLIFSGKFHSMKKCIQSFGQKVIFLTDGTEYRSEERKICQWVCEQTDYILVTTTPYIKGFECEAIIDLTSMQEPDVLSRATIRVIKASGMMSEIIDLEDEFVLTKMLGMYCKITV